MAGNFAGTITVGNLLKHGSTRIGTFAGLDGELVILDNEVYQAVASGRVSHITDMDATMPFAAVHFPQKTQPITLTDVNFARVNHDLVATHQLNNVFAFLQLHGAFERVKTRIAPKQEQPYPTLLEVAQHQPEFSATDITGTVLSYYAPAIFGTITAAGWHLRFISDDCQFAGHLLDFAAQSYQGAWRNLITWSSTCRSKTAPSGRARLTCGLFVRESLSPRGVRNKELDEDFTK